MLVFSIFLFFTKPPSGRACSGPRRTDCGGGVDDQRLARGRGERIAAGRRAEGGGGSQRTIPWPIQPRSPPPSPALWRPGGPSRRLSTPEPGPAPSAAAGSDRARSTGCVLGRERTTRRTSTGPTPGTSPWISPLGSTFNGCQKTESRYSLLMG